jgi:hypothetical protein
LAAVLDRVGRDLTAIVSILIAVAVVIGAVNNLTRALAAHGLGVRQLAAVSSTVATPIAVAIADFAASVFGASSITGAVSTGGIL